MKIASSQQLNAMFRDLRQHANLTQVQLAAQLGLSRGTIYDRERRTGQRRTRLDVDELVQAADLFGLDVVLIRRDTGKPA